MDTGSGASHQEEDRRTFLQGIGKAVTDFLEPFGIKVDVDVLGGEKAAEPKDADPSSTPATVSDHSIILQSCMIFFLLGAATSV